MDKHSGDAEAIPMQTDNVLSDERLVALSSLIRTRRINMKHLTFIPNGHITISLTKALKQQQQRST